MGIAEGLAEHAGKSLVGAMCGDSAALEGMYRFMENPRIKAEEIREGGFGATARKLSDYPVLLAVEDSTTLSYPHEVEGAGDLGGPSDAPGQGLWVHSVLLVDPAEGLTVGLLEQSWWARPSRKIGKQGKEQARKYEEKESFKWQRASEALAARTGDRQARLISVCDRESDVFEYLSHKVTQGQRFVVRSSVDRALDGSGMLLEEEVDSWWPNCVRTIEVPQRGGRRKRTVRLQVSAGEVTLPVPGDRPKGDLKPVTLNVVQAAEEDAPEGETPLHWRLFTTEPIETREQLELILNAYEFRWRIEDFHKVWKTGCGVEELRLRTADNLARAASILAFTAVRLLCLRELTEREPQAPCTQVFDHTEWNCLWVCVEKTRPPATPPNIAWAHTAITRLGGSYASKNKHRIGWHKYWQGYVRFQDLLLGWLLHKDLPNL